MKFGKEFKAELVQEWQEAYADYSKLKTCIKNITDFQEKNRSSSVSGRATLADGGLKRRVTLYRAFSGLTNRHRSSSASEDEIILVNPSHEDPSGKYHTTFLRASEEGGEYELVFFRRLDDEFNKVLKFYKKKVAEVLNEAEELTRQMGALIAFRIKVDNPIVAGTTVVDLASRDDSHAPPPPQPSPRPTADKKTEMAMMDVIQENNATNDKEKTENNKELNKSKPSMKGFKPAKLDVLDHVRLNVEPESPRSTIKGLLLCSKPPDISFNKVELKKAEDRLSNAFIEFYNKLRLLKSFSFLNQMALAKIMKKYDKATSRNASKAYLHMVENSYLGSSDEVSKLMDKVEATYIKHFMNGNHRKGMGNLRPVAHKERHRITYFLGFFSGCTVALSVAIALIVKIRHMNESRGANRYMENIFPLYSLFGYIALHLSMYAGDIYFWKRYRVNYMFIFGFKDEKDLAYRQVLLLSSSLSVLTFAGVISNLNMEMDPRTKSFGALTELVPLGLLITLVLVTFCPFNIVYRSSRFFFIRCVFRCLCSPLYKVSLPDFFLADQITSQVQAIRCTEFYVCYYGWGDFKKRSNHCLESDIYRKFYTIVAIIPYWFRLMQCVRRLIEEKEVDHMYNGFKYLSTILAVTCRTAYDFRKGPGLFFMAITVSTISTMINTYWDLVMDWGLLRRNSKNPWLRDKLLIPNKSVYFIAMVVNVMLRLAWMQSVLGMKDTPYLHRTALTAVVASLEIIRRGIWSFFRLENEHLNNVGKYRAFKSVPLPFYYEKT